MKIYTLAVLSALALAACGQEAPKTETVRPVKVVKAQAAGGDTLAAFAGEIRARHETDLAFRVGGKLLARPVDLGARVGKGQLLAQLDPEDLRLAAAASRAQVASAEADFAFAKAELERYEQLLKQKFISETSLDAKKNAYAAALARRDATRAQASVSGNQAEYAELRADFAGVITAVNAEPGQVVAAGQAVVKLARLGALDAVIAVAESQIANLRKTKAVRVVLWSQPDKVYAGRIREIAAAADPATRTYLVKVEIEKPDDALRLGMTANVVLLDAATSPTPITLVPLAAVYQKGDEAAVWVVGADNTVKLRRVKVQQYREHNALIASGLQAGETVVAAGVHKLREGDAVQPLPEGTMFGSRSAPPSFSSASNAF